MSKEYRRFPKRNANIFDLSFVVIFTRSKIDTAPMAIESRIHPAVKVQ